MVDYRLKAQPIEIAAEIKPTSTIWREMRHGAAWVVWKFRCLVGSKVR